MYFNKTFFFLSVSLLLLAGCFKHQHETTLITAKHTEPSLSIENGKHELNLGSTLFINKGFYWRDGYIYIPKMYRKSTPIPLLIWLHGGGGDASDADHMLQVADQYNVAILSLDSRHNTWDGIDSPFGPDVRFIDKALSYVFERVAIDSTRIALGGLSDGGTYALALGRSNGEIFTHLVAVSPWRLSPPSDVKGNPHIFIGHGKRDNVYPIAHTRHFIVPGLKDDGYEVKYLEFNGPHWATVPAVREILKWLVDTPSNSTN